MCLFLGTYSYISDQSSKEYRTLRIGIVDFIFYGGITIGYGKFWFDLTKDKLDDYIACPNAQKVSIF